MKLVNRTIQTPTFQRVSLFPKWLFFIISVVGFFFIWHYKWIPISIQKNVPLKGSTCFEVASQIVDLNQFCFILYVLLWTRHICNVMLKNSYQFLWFKNYSIFLDEHFSVLLIIDSSLSNLWTTGLYSRAEVEWVEFLHLNK